MRFVENIKEEENIKIKEEILKEFEPYKKDMKLARVVRVNRDLYDLVFEGKEIKGKVSGRFSYIVSGTADYPCVGDYVIFHLNDEIGIIHKVCSRFSELSRSEVGGTSNRQVIAANIDLVFICVSLNNDFNLRKINRFLSIVYGSKAKPIILLTKKDLSSNVDEIINQVRAIEDNLDVYAISVFNADDVDVVKDIIKGKTSVYLGASGVGKSTLVNEIVGSEVLETNEIRESDSQGRHTTVHREMFFIEELDSAIIDTPGIRTIQSYITEDMDLHYSDIYEYAKRCRFSDCKHNHEPDCAVLEAIDEGELSIERFDNYKKALKITAYNIKRERIRESRKK
ncbi:ribosome small subunit-dependent GTPase A [Mycoplasmatota bacterium WC44]